MKDASIMVIDVVIEQLLTDFKEDLGCDDTITTSLMKQSCSCNKAVCTCLVHKTLSCNLDGPPDPSKTYITLLSESVQTALIIIKFRDHMTNII